MNSNFLSEHFEILKQDLSLLASKLKTNKAQYAAVTVIPPTTKERENSPVDRIDIDIQSGKTAQLLAAQCYQDIYIKPGLSQKAARRTVGVLWYSPALTPDAFALIELLKRINETKMTIESYLTANYLDRKARFEAMHSAAPGVMTIHLYRAIKYFDSGLVSSIQFTWKQKELVQRPDKRELLGRVHMEFDRSSDEYRIPLERLMYLIESTPEESLRVRRSVKAQPYANIIDNEQPDSINAPTPMILFQDRKPTIKLPGPFSSEKGKKPRSDRARSLVLGSFGGVQIEALTQVEQK